MTLTTIHCHEITTRLPAAHAAGASGEITIAAMLLLTLLRAEQPDIPHDHPSLPAGTPPPQG